MADRTCPECGRTATRNGYPVRLTRGVCQGCLRRHSRCGTEDTLAPSKNAPRIPMSVVFTEKPCGECKTVKKIEEFSLDRKATDGRQGRCKSCFSARYRASFAADPSKYRARQLWCNFRITLEQYDKILADQGGVCAVCRREPPSARNFSVDHNHTCCPGKKSCGKCNRGLLCSNCNMGIGLFADDPVRLMRAINYLGGDGMT